MLIAKELKTGATLDGAFDAMTLECWIGSFANEDFHARYGEPEIELSEYARSRSRLINTRDLIAKAAEPLTREGVISDVAAVLVVGLAQTVRAIATGKDLAEVKAAVASLQPFADAVLSQLVTAADMRDPVAAMQAGKVLMPYMVKGDAAKVVKDMGQLANGVSAALLAARRAG